MQTVEKLTIRNALRAEPSAWIGALQETLDDLERYAAAWRDSTQERWPRIRFGEREYIPAAVRRLIFERDGYCCLSCGTPLTIKTGQLDHIVPWSAGGPDTSDNLRLLCEPCNTDRSNYRTALDDYAVSRPPVAFWCVACAHLDDEGNETREPYEVTPGMVTAYCGWCGAVSPTWPEELY